LKTFSSVTAKDPAEVVPADVFEFLTHQRGDPPVGSRVGAVGSHDRPAAVVGGRVLTRI
jgi:hypothetical protein